MGSLLSRFAGWFGRSPVIAEPEPEMFGPFTRNAFDATINWMAGQGGAGDKSTATAWAQAMTENWQSLTNIYRSSWLARKIVRSRPDDMLRAGILLDWDGMAKAGKKGKEKKSKESDQIKRAAKRWGIVPKLRESLYWSGLYGGSIIVIGVDGEDLTTPLPIKNGAVSYEGIGKNSLRYLHVFDRWRASHSGVIDNDPTSPNVGRPTFYTLGSGAEMMGQQVHWTRVIRFDGALVPWHTWRANMMWMDSELQAVIEALKMYDSTTSSIASLIFEANIDVILASGLTGKLATDEGRRAVEARYEIAKRGKSNNRILVLDKDKEEYSRHPFQFSGLDKIWEKVMTDVSGGAGYPITRLFGRSPDGMNATGENDMRNYYDLLASSMETDLRPRAELLYELVIRNELGYMPDGFEITFGPLWQPTAVEKSTIDLNRANRDKIFVESLGASQGLVMREAKEDGIFRTIEDEDVLLAEELSGGIDDTEDDDTDDQVATVEGDVKPTGTITLTPTTMAGIITVNQALASVGMPPRDDADGNLTVAEFTAKHSGVMAAAVQVENGDDPKKPKQEPEAAPGPTKRPPPVVGKTEK